MSDAPQSSKPQWPTPQWPTPQWKAPSWKVSICTLFEDMFPGPLACSIAGAALKQNKWAMDIINIRDFAKDKHKTVDDAPFGGGVGMVMRPDVVADAVAFALKKDENPKNVPKLYFSPRGKKIDQEMIKRLAQASKVIMVCGRYEGLDQRAIDALELEEVSIGDYILSGGEVAAIATIDAIVRILPDVISKPEAHIYESFENNLLECPLYTRPRIWDNKEVPEILTSGDHQKIEKWRHEQAENITKKRRPDMWEKYIKNSG